MVVGDFDAQCLLSFSRTYTILSFLCKETGVWILGCEALARDLTQATGNGLSFHFLVHIILIIPRYATTHCRKCV